MPSCPPAFLDNRGIGVTKGWRVVLIINNNGRKVITGEIENRLVEALFEAGDRNGAGRVTFSEWSQLNPDGQTTLFRPETPAEMGSLI